MAALTDPLAFGELYDLYYPKIFNYILRRIGEVAIAADITSDVFFKVMKNLVKFEHIRIDGDWPGQFTDFYSGRLW